MRLRPFFVVSLLAGSLWAQPADNKAESDRLFKEGVALHDQKSYAAAREKFAAAYAKFPSPNSLFNLARMEQLVGQCVPAVRHFDAYLALPDNPRITGADRDEARADKDECLAKIGRITIKAPNGTTIRVAGSSVAWTPGEPIDVEPGTYELVLDGPGGSRSRTVTCAAGRIMGVDYDNPEVRALPSPPPPSSARGGRSAAGWIVPIVLGAVGVGGLALGAGFGVASQDAQSAAAALRPACADRASATCLAFQDRQSAQSAAATASVIGWIAGAVFLAAGAGAFFFWPTKGERVSVAPVLGPSTAGVNVVTTF